MTITKEHVIAELAQMKQERFAQCDRLNVLNGQIAYAEHLVATWEGDEPMPPAAPAPPPALQE